MQAVILAGGLGTRLSEETGLKPKPMVEIGGKPILWHILKIYSHYGINDFIICLGYKGYQIKDYFANYSLRTSDITFNLKTNSLEVHQTKVEPWRITLIDTGEKTLTGGRLARIRKYLKDEPFCLTYGDGVGDINIKSLVRYHLSNNSLATLTAVQPPGRYGAIEIEGDNVISFQEKVRDNNAWINGGFFVLNPKVIDLINGDQCMWEDAPLRALAAQGELKAYKHTGFWHPMDTLRDRHFLEKEWASGNAPWKVW